MGFRVSQENEDGVALESSAGNLRVDLWRDSRWLAFVRVLVPGPEKGSWRGHAGAPIAGGTDPYAPARERLLAAATADRLPESDPGELSRAVIEAICPEGGERTLRTPLEPANMHDGQVVAFLECELREHPETPGPVRARLDRYRMTAHAYESNTSLSFMVGDLDFEGDWVYSMAIDLVRRQHEPGSAFCFIVAAEPADDEFHTGFIRFRSQLDAISGGYVHFFAVSNLNGQASAGGKHQLAAELREAGIAVRADEAFLVAIRLRKKESLRGEPHFEADVMGVVSLAGKVSADDVKPLLMSIVKLARESKLAGESFEVFQQKLERKVAWVRTFQRLPRLWGLLEKLRTAAKFLEK